MSNVYSAYTQQVLYAPQEDDRHTPASNNSNPFIEYIISSRLNLCVSSVWTAVVLCAAASFWGIPDRHPRLNLLIYRIIFSSCTVAFTHNIRYTCRRRRKFQQKQIEPEIEPKQLGLSQMNICSLCWVWKCNRSILWLLSSHRLRKYGFIACLGPRPPPHHPPRW